MAGFDTAMRACYFVYDLANKYNLSPPSFQTKEKLEYGDVHWLLENRINWIVNQWTPFEQWLQEQKFPGRVMLPGRVGFVDYGEAEEQTKLLIKSGGGTVEYTKEDTSKMAVSSISEVVTRFSVGMSVSGGFSFISEMTAKSDFGMEWKNTEEVKREMDDKVSAKITVDKGNELVMKYKRRQGKAYVCRTTFESSQSLTTKEINGALKKMVDKIPTIQTFLDRGERMNMVKWAFMMYMGRGADDEDQCKAFFEFLKNTAQFPKTASEALEVTEMYMATQPMP